MKEQQTFPSQFFIVLPISMLLTLHPVGLDPTLVNCYRVRNERASDV